MRLQNVSFMLKLLFLLMLYRGAEFNLQVSTSLLLPFIYFACPSVVAYVDFESL